jgi:3-keto-5-aminohexanoate cleavage enzyme
MEKVIITAAVTGSRIQRDKAPFIPITPEEITRSAIECREAGAAVVHIHVRDPETHIGSQRVDLFERVVEPIRSETDALICMTTSGIPGKNLPDEQRLAPLSLKPDLASFDAGSINLGGKIFINSDEFLDRAASVMKEYRIKPEIEIFDLGMVFTALRMRDRSKLEDPLHFQFVLGTPAGAPATPAALLHLLDHIPENATWSTAGIGRGQFDMAMIALVSGGHFRVGMEDNIYLSRGVMAKTNAELVDKAVRNLSRGVMAKTNAELVDKAVRICESYGRKTATPEEAKQILSL